MSGITQSQMQGIESSIDDFSFAGAPTLDGEITGSQVATNGNFTNHDGVEELELNSLFGNELESNITTYTDASGMEGEIVGMSQATNDGSFGSEVVGMSQTTNPGILNSELSSLPTSDYSQSLDSDMSGLYYDTNKASIASIKSELTNLSDIEGGQYTTLDGEVAGMSQATNSSALDSEVVGMSQATNPSALGSEVAGMSQATNSGVLDSEVVGMSQATNSGVLDGEVVGMSQATNPGALDGYLTGSHEAIEMNSNLTETKGMESSITSGEVNNITDSTGMLSELNSFVDGKMLTDSLIDFGDVQLVNGEIASVTSNFIPISSYAEAAQESGALYCEIE